MINHKRNLLVIFLLFVASLSLMFLPTLRTLLHDNEVLDKSSFDLSETAKKSLENPEASIVKSLIDKNNILTTGLAECSSALAFNQQRHIDWYSYSPDFTDELIADYSAERIGIAFVSSGVSNFKVRNKLDQLAFSQSDSELRNKNFREQNQLKRKSLAPDSKIQLTFGVGVNEDELISLFELEREQRDYLLSQVNILAKDLESLVVGEKLKQEQVIELLSYVADINQTIGSGFQSSLIAVAIRYNKEKIYEYLLSRGAEPFVNDALKYNVLEYLLFSSHSRQESSFVEFIERRLPIIDSLLSLGATVRWQLQPDSNLYHIGPGCGDFKYSSGLADKIDILQKLGLISSQSYDYSQECHVERELENRISRIKQDFIFIGKTDGFVQSVKNCIQMDKEARSIITRNDHKIVRDSLSIEELNALEPGLADCKLYYQEFRASKQLEYMNSSVMQQLVFSYRKAPIDSINGLQQLNWDRIGRAVVFWNFFSLKNIELSPILESGFEPNLDDYSAIARLSKSEFIRLNSLGFNYVEKDKFGKTAVYHAVSQCNISLLSHLQTQDYPYDFNTLGADALGKLLRLGTYTCRDSKDSDKNSKLALLRNLMLFEPPIKDYHLDRMAELRLTEREFYERVVKEFPQLKPKKNSFPSGYTCFEY